MAHDSGHSTHTHRVSKRTSKHSSARGEDPLEKLDREFCHCKILHDYRARNAQDSYDTMDKVARKLVMDNLKRELDNVCSLIDDQIVQEIETVLNNQELFTMLKNIADKIRQNRDKFGQEQKSILDKESSLISEGDRAVESKNKTELEEVIKRLKKECGLAAWWAEQTKGIK
ncbi:uncharacterized protein FOMMEDRAFT_29529 [Fomitiporia mediterranea MF3/22]|uniref:uncharacterized protein n=1 Tax=Fomitiporia mediterranea (strain MF3/22) TaxID=694068 RepID=UPI0004409AB6|nr:uncharacterized protein FOMMEDRAFT_29529 [Fomitiporia mediterranea MF3/22]EJD02534.1 hypothetical protein FOMMEDRAFT_29529 [Fomitiporia mediterranea MF3/22]